MRLAIGSDHAGFGLKDRLATWLRSAAGGKHQVRDTGCKGFDSCDYPDYALSVGRAVVSGQASRGILICGTGIGMCIAANKVKGVRAAPCHDSITVEMSRRHNDANVLCLSADLLGDELISHMIRIFLETEFEGGRHARRVDKIMRYEDSSMNPPA